MKPPKLQLYTKILLGMALGVAFGTLAENLGLSGWVARYIKPVGSLFVKLISMVVVPLVFASLLVAAAGLNDIRKLGRIGGKTVAYYLCTTAIAVTIGLLLANALRPGKALPPELRDELLRDYDRQAEEKIEHTLEKPNVTDVILGIVPANPVKAFVDGNMLQIIFMALLAGLCLALVGPERNRPVLAFFEGINDLVVQMVHVIMKLAPYGVFALVCAVVAGFGAGILLALLRYSAVVIAGLLLHVLLVYPLALKLFSNLSVGSFFRGIYPAQLIAFSSGSSSATLPVTMQCAEQNLGVSSTVGSFVLPLGATINMDGTALYQGVSAVFIAQVLGIDLAVSQQLAIVLTATLASVGTSGTPGAGVVTLAIVLESIGVPLQGIALILGAERVLDMCRSVVNVTGDACCAAVVDAGANRL